METLIKYISEQRKDSFEERVLELIWNKFKTTNKWPSLKSTKKVIKDTISPDSSTVIDKLQPLFMFNPDNGSREQNCKLTIVGILSISNGRDYLLDILIKYSY